MTQAEKVIEQLKGMDVDGETMQHILEQVGMDDQMHRQLVMTKSTEATKELLEEKESFEQHTATDKQGLRDEVSNFIEYYTSDDDERNKMKSALEDYIEEVVE